MKSINSSMILILWLLLAAVGCHPAAPEATRDQVVKAQYTCPMHPQINEDAPGSCPICGMTLVKRSGQATEGAGITLSTVLQPVNSAVISSVTAVTPRQLSLKGTVSAQGYLDFDSRTFNNISARYAGRIDKLYIKYAFQQISRGQRIFDIYSPDMVAAQQDVLYIAKSPTPDIALLNLAKQKLLLLGMSATQVAQVIKNGKPFYSIPVYSPYSGHVHDVMHSQMVGQNDVRPEQNIAVNAPLAIQEGMYVQQGQVLFNVVDAHRIWAVLKVEPADMLAVKLNQPVKLTVNDMPGDTLTAKVNFIEPFFQGTDKSTSLRVYLDNMGHNLKVNSLVRAVIQTRPVAALWIPRAALLQLGTKAIVWLKTGNLYKAHPVVAGAGNGNLVQIIKGLSLTDSIAGNAQYLTDSESFIKTSGHDN
jgi:Cu(I)/Ag(I) efflux system membrane fusion protein